MIETFFTPVFSSLPCKLWENPFSTASPIEVIFSGLEESKFGIECVGEAIDLERALENCAGWPWVNDELTRRGGSAKEDEKSEDSELVEAESIFSPRGRLLGPAAGVFGWACRDIPSKHLAVADTVGEIGEWYGCECDLGEGAIQ